MKDIVLTTINAKWIHPSLALRLLKANLGELEDRCDIIEFALRQPLAEKIAALSSVQPRILGISVSIWNHTATLELLRTLYPKPHTLNPIIVLGGPEVSHLPEDSEIFKHADFVIRGEGEIAFYELCKKILAGEKPEKFIEAENVDVNKIKTAYHLYTDEDVTKKLIYVESSRGCPFSCEFCLSSLCVAGQSCRTDGPREFFLEDFLLDIDMLVKRGVKTFKFLDRTFNANIKRAIKICDFFLEKLNNQKFTVHFELVPAIITPELIETLARFPPGSLRLEIGIQSLNPEVAARIKLPGRSGKTAEQILEPLRILRQKTNAIIHADLIAGLPGEDIESFGMGFNALWKSCVKDSSLLFHNFEIQLGILKQLPGAPISRHNEVFGMRYNPQPPYEVLETSTMSAEDIARLKNFARFWEILVNRGLFYDEIMEHVSKKSSEALETSLRVTVTAENASIFHKFMAFSDALFTHFGRNWGIDKEELKSTSLEFWQKLSYN